MSSTEAAKDIALVIGASSGIGAVHADRLAKRCHDLILVARDVAKLAALADRVRSGSGAAPTEWDDWKPVRDVG